jgi:UDP-N-acetylmuramoyl-tripeptide--D-alanyl-D-alanine ligase
MSAFETETIGLVLGMVGSSLGGLRWLRVAQREHYLAGSVSRFALRWWLPATSVANTALFVVSFLAAEVTVRSDIPTLLKLSLVLLAVICALLLPLGLSLRGRTSKLALTARLKRLGLTANLLALLLMVVGIFLHLPYLVDAVVPLLYPLLVDLALWMLAPVEARSLTRFVVKAEEKLRRIDPKVVAVTGSFGKTTTKNFIFSLLSESLRCSVTPASFNNRGGLARSVNETLDESTEIFVAEMGTFARGEIADLCAWIHPDVAVICALGPVHLERFGSEDEILRAKLEITTDPEVVVVCVDYPKLALAANELELKGKRVWRVSEFDFGAKVSVRTNDEGEFVVYHEQRRIGALPQGDVPAGNVGCAVAVALEVGLDTDTIAKGLSRLTSSPNRLTSQVVSESGIEVLDDTYNSNPAGARRALAALDRRRLSGKRATVVTPGMVELGDRQFVENFRLGRAVAEIASTVIVVGRTNRRALDAGLAEGLAEGVSSATQVIHVRTREQAVAWVRSHLGEFDAVLYENDLPDHFP